MLMPCCSLQIGRSETHVCGRIMLCPKYERVRQMVKEGAIGDIYMLKQGERPQDRIPTGFMIRTKSGGGVLMDMGCHAIAWFRWMLNNPKA